MNNIAQFSSQSGSDVISSALSNGKIYQGGHWPDLLPICQEGAAHEYPLDALPLTVRLAVDEVRGYSQAPIALIGSSALSALSGLM